VNTQSLRTLLAAVRSGRLTTAAALERLRGRVAHGCPARLGIRVRDSFLPANGGDHTLTFTGGELADVVGPAVLDPLTPDAILEGDVADLSSLLAGSVRLRALYDYGLATLSNPSFVGALDEFFACDPPRCTTAF